MLRIGKRLSMLRLVVELVEEIVALAFVELRLAVLEIKRNVRSVENGALMLVLGAGLLVLSLLGFIITAIAILAIFLPTWLSALLVTLTLVFFGIAFLFTGLGKFKDFSLVPSETLQRVEEISRNYKKVSTRIKVYEERAVRQRAPRSPGQGQVAQ
jgi:hypothetical protein